MASGRKKENDALQLGELAELSQDVLSVMVHELGGIAGALDLRATAMAKSAPPQDLDALRELAQQLRVAIRGVRLLRDRDGSGMLAISKPLPLAEWWRLASRLTAMALPRGVAVESQFDGGQLAPTQSAALTWMWLLACKELADRGLTTPVTVTVRGSGTDGGDVLLLAEVPADRVSPADTASRWTRHAAKLARDAGAKPPTWSQDKALIRWRCDMKGGRGS